MGCPRLPPKVGRRGRAIRSYGFVGPPARGCPYKAIPLLSLTRAPSSLWPTQATDPIFAHLPEGYAERAVPNYKKTLPLSGPNQTYEKRTPR